MEAFIEWCHKSGIMLNPKVRPHKFDTIGWGMIATEHICDDEILVSVPEHSLITISSVDFKLNKFQSCHLNCLNAFDGLILFVLNCKIDSQLKNEFGPYIDILPKAFTTPISSKDLQLETLPPGTKELFLQQKEDVQKSFHRVKVVFDRELNKSLDYESFLWAWTTVNSRCIYLETSQPSPSFLFDETVCYAVAPMLDLFNHSDEFKAYAQFNRKTKSFDVSTCSNVSIYPGDQIYICYGPHSNAKLYLEYGFTMSFNGNNSIELNTKEVARLCVLAGINYIPEALKILEEQEWKIILYQVQSEPCWNTLSFCYILSLPSEKLSEWKLVYKMEEIYDRRAIELLSTLLVTLLEQLQTSFAKVEMAIDSELRRLWNDQINIVKQSIEQTQVLVFEIDD